MCLPDARVGDIAVRCLPDAAASRCSGEAVTLTSGGPGGGSPVLTQFRIDLTAAMSGVVAGGTTSGTLKVCLDSTIPPTIPFQTSSNGLISVSSLMTLPVGGSIAAEIDINSMPSGTTR